MAAIKEGALKEWVQKKNGTPPEEKPKRTGRGFKPGDPKPPNSGRKRGQPNKNTAALRDMILMALDKQPGGGVKYLAKQAVEQPVAFMGLLGKVLPTQLAGDQCNPIAIEVTAKTIGRMTDEQLEEILRAGNSRGRATKAP